ncbi:MAG: protein phosphatase 2C domain-containing protein [Verrucomicrobiota bacterium]
MKIAKDGIRSKVRVGYDGKVYKTFRGTDADKRFDNEIRVLKVLEARGCDYVPRLLDADPETLTMVTSNCGKPVSNLSDEKTKSLFDDLQKEFGVIHDDPFDRNITYHERMGRFCIIDFELAQVLDEEPESADFVVLWGGETQDGTRKAGNDDSLAAFASDDGWARELQLKGKSNLGEQGVVLAVSDGMGGVRGGDFASQVAVSELRRFLPGRMGDFGKSADPLAELESAVGDLHDHVNRLAATHSFKGMGATLVCGLFVGSTMHFAHVGDSRIYRFHDGELTQLTMDHTRVGRMFRDGKINEREARNHPNRNVLLQVIGADCLNVKPQLGTCHLEPGDWFLFCSDGVIDGLWDKNIRAIFEEAVEKNQSPPDVAKVILERSTEEAGRDDTTLFAVKILEAEPS